MKDIAAIREALRNVIQQVMEYGDDIPEEVAFMLQKVLERAGERITALNKANEGGSSANPISPQISELWQLAGGNEDAFTNYLRTVPNPALNSLLRSPAQLQSTLAKLQQQMPPHPRGEEGGIPEAPLDSSNIYGFDYDPGSRKLAVRFQSGDIYTYNGVPPGVFMVFKQGAVPAKTSGSNQYGTWWRGKQPSLGAAFYEMIRSGGYPYQKIA